MWRSRGFRRFGRGYCPGLGLGYRRGLWDFGNRNLLQTPGYGMGRGLGPNASLNCRWFPWLPRWWWANPAYSQNVPFTNIPYNSSMPIPTMTNTQEKQILESQLKISVNYDYQMPEDKCDVCGCHPVYTIRTEFGTFCKEHARYI